MQAQDLKMWVGTFNMAYKDTGLKEPDSWKRLKEFIPDGYDIYVIGVQEAISEALFEAMNKLFFYRKQEQKRIPFYCKVEGRGDGAILTTKFTGLCIYAKEKL